MIITTLFAALYTFFIDHSGDIASKMVASAGYDILKKTLNFKDLTSKIKGFFKKDDQAEKFIEQICNRQIIEDEDSLQVLYSAFENVTGEAFPPALLEKLKSWFEANKDTIVQSSNVNFTNTTGFNVGAQQAKGNIYNIQGNFNSEHGKKED